MHTYICFPVCPVLILNYTVCPRSSDPFMYALLFLKSGISGSSGPKSSLPGFVVTTFFVTCIGGTKSVRLWWSNNVLSHTEVVQTAVAQGVLKCDISSIGGPGVPETPAPQQ